MKRFALALVIALGASLFAHADKIFLKDGREYEGKIVEETDTTVKIRVSKGTFQLKKEEIDRIEKGSSAVEELDTLLEALSPESPLGYVEAAERCVTGAVGDGLTVERLASIATSLDPSLCGRAQGAVGDWYAGKGNRSRAAEAYLAAYTADWKNVALRDKFLKFRESLAEQKKSQVKRLADALTLALEGKLAEAIPGVQNSSSVPGASLVSTYCMGAPSYAAFLADLRARVPCKTCQGKLWTKCYVCSGVGNSKCGTCDGKGFKEKKKNGQVIERTDCVTCNGKTTIRCPRCKERAGQMRCSTCKGVAAKPTLQWDKRGITAWRDALLERMQGTVPAEEQIGPKLPRLGETTFDESFTDDGKIVYSGGRWVTPEEKK